MPAEICTNLGLVEGSTNERSSFLETKYRFPKKITLKQGLEKLPGFRVV
jgi:hypothetical protein